MMKPYQQLPIEFSILKQREFEQIRQFLYEEAGIFLSDIKKSLVASRLCKRLKETGYQNYGDYFEFVKNNLQHIEYHHFIDALTTNETFFFRENEHFDFVKQLIKDHSQKKSWQAWSAACSSGEEAYSLAMLFADILGIDGQWQVQGSDISQRVLAKAELAHYLLERNEGIGFERLQKYCLKGVGRQSGTFLIDDILKDKVSFFTMNLTQSCESVGMCDVIFIRNVMIYFDADSKQRVINNVVKQLKVGGYLFISHTESLMHVNHRLKQIKPSIYQRI
ncbi:chemotaxis protein methyltransferase CheR [Shewanella decolorationis S12]|uniref:Chemotaxis protein methyltransferase n=2 Tax=Shewanella decolorationis TaxID=256839 RepID=A0ABN0PT22_9GAMM|nr:chemotaxis protein methyltransferase CheR [Shewanella decolorationis S12]